MEKDISYSNNVEKEDDFEFVVYENEFEKCLCKGRWDVCLDIYCKCVDFEYSKECLFYKGVVDSNLIKESVKENMWILKCIFCWVLFILFFLMFFLYIIFLFLVGWMILYWLVIWMKWLMKWNFYRNGVFNFYFKEKLVYFN